MSVAQAAFEIPMPRLSDAMEEATILAWLKRPGDPLTVGEPLVEIETDKATMVYEAELDGTLEEILVAEGEVAALGAPIARALASGLAPAGAPASASPRARATPVARRMAADFGIDLATLSGTGPRGRIVRADVLAAAASAGDRPSPKVEARGEDEQVQLDSLRRTIARRMVASRTEIPEFTLYREVDVTAALELRAQLLEEGVRVSVNDLVVKATAYALRLHPSLNASFEGDSIVRHRRVNVGIAVAAEEALLVPVIADADLKTVPEISATSRALGKRARARTAGAEELSGGTFTVSNLGMFGIETFDAVINQPEVAILAVGAAHRRPRFDVEGNLAARDLMKLSLTCDHRAVYGADGARFLQQLAELLERPTLLLLPAGAAEMGEEN